MDVYEEYGLYRSFRRSSNSEVLNKGVKEEVIVSNNRWRKEGSGNKENEIKDVRSLYGYSCYIENLYAIFTDFVREDEC